LGSGSSSAPLKAVLFDAGNTLLFLDYDRIAEAVGAATGIRLTGRLLAAGAGAAAAALEGTRVPDRQRAAAYFERLFLEAGVARDRMPEVTACLERMHETRHLWSAIAADTHDALGRLRSAGLRLGVVSNSDGRVEAALAAAGLSHYFEVVVDSTLAGVEKPDPAIFRAALDALAVPPAQTVYVGDLYEVDILGARAVGMRAVLFVPPGRRETEGSPLVRSLSALADDLLQENVPA
jgi:putative hydrolase of the HAD superfamily